MTLCWLIDPWLSNVNQEALRWPIDPWLAYVNQKTLRWLIDHRHAYVNHVTLCWLIDPRLSNVNQEALRWLIDPWLAYVNQKTLRWPIDPQHWGVCCMSAEPAATQGSMWKSGWAHSATPGPRTSPSTSSGGPTWPTGAWVTLLREGERWGGGSSWFLVFEQFVCNNCYFSVSIHNLFPQHKLEIIIYLDKGTYYSPINKLIINKLTPNRKH
jgi:hypothetical protein